MNLIYIADPMCSWCYGFGSTMDALLAEPGAAAPLQLALMMGGLRPYTTDPMTPESALEIRGHWARVQEVTGLPFCAPGQAALDQPGFVYDTEPASRAVVAVRSRWPRLVWRYFKAVQHAFYAEGLDVTQPAILADVALALGIPHAEFAVAFAGEEARVATAGDFRQAQDWGIRGFPALIAERGEALHLLSQGYSDEAELRSRLAQLAGH